MLRGNSDFPAMDSTMNDVVELCRLVQGGGWESGDLQEFRTKLTELMVNERCLAELDVYLFNCLCYAQRSDLDGFKPACWMRSAAQLLHDMCVDWGRPGSGAIREVFEEMTEEIDETIRVSAWEIPPVLEEDLPDWVPESHWWWRAPIRKDMSPEERDRRINYEIYDIISDSENEERRKND